MANPHIDRSIIDIMAISNVILTERETKFTVVVLLFYKQSNTHTKIGINQNLMLCLVVCTVFYLYYRSNTFVINILSTLSFFETSEEVLNERNRD